MKRVDRIRLFHEQFGNGFLGYAGDWRTKAGDIGWVAGLYARKKFYEAFGKFPNELRAECKAAGFTEHKHAN